MTTSDRSRRTRETRLRRMAERQGLALHKSRRRDPRALDYGAYWLANRGDDHVRVDVPGTDLDAIERFLMWEVE